MRIILASKSLYDKGIQQFGPSLYSTLLQQPNTANEKAFSMWTTSDNRKRVWATFFVSKNVAHTRFRMSDVVHIDVYLQSN